MDEGIDDIHSPSPRDVVLSNIRKMMRLADVFIHSVHAGFDSGSHTS